ncbi:MAG: hybrid sensor histidine kinase/response regulator [Chloroflexi bacterium]|nr:MAG: hybrid sensor histidine kinase/response regulator [Chloroflexota bacterium]
MPFILVVEDSEELLEGVIEILERAGHKAVGALNAIEGMRLARRQCPDLIVSDIMLPGVSGLQFLEHIRKDPKWPPIPVILITAKTARETMRQGMEIGADDFITKPFSPDELVRAINARLDRQKEYLTWSNRNIEKARRRLVDVVAHELRTPLASITTTQEYLREQLEDLSREELVSLIDTMGAGSQRLYHLVEQTVLLTQFESGMMDETYINEYGIVITHRSLIDSAVEQARRFTYRTVAVDTKIEYLDEIIGVRGDPTAMIHALSEIVMNAMMYSPKNGQVQILNREIGNYVEITIVDEGPGVPKEHLKEMSYNLFYQIDRDRQQQQGLGLGLALARRVIEVHGGQLQIFSGPGGGLTVTVTLPRYAI